MENSFFDPARPTESPLRCVLSRNRSTLGSVTVRYRVFFTTKKCFNYVSIYTRRDIRLQLRFCIRDVDCFLRPILPSVLSRNQPTRRIAGSPHMSVRFWVFYITKKYSILPAAFYTFPERRSAAPHWPAATRSRPFEPPRYLFRVGSGVEPVSLLSVGPP